MGIGFSLLLLRGLTIPIAPSPGDWLLLVVLFGGGFCLIAGFLMWNRGANEPGRQLGLGKAILIGLLLMPIAFCLVTWVTFAIHALINN
jgi:hypothetical protein